MADDESREMELAGGVIGIVVHGEPTSPARPNLDFVWGPPDAPSAPSLPFGRWKTVKAA